MGKYLQDKGINDLYVHGAELPGRQGHGRRASSATTRAASSTRSTPSSGSRTTRPRSASCARRTPRRCSCSIPGGMGIQFLKQYDAGRPARPDPALHGVHGGRDHAARGQGRRPRQYEARFWSPDLKNAGEPEVRRRLQEEVRLHAVVLRRAELRRHHADRLRRARRQGQPEGHEGLVEAMRKAELQVDARQVPVTTSTTTRSRTSTCCKAVKGAERRGRDADPEDGLREAQGRRTTKSAR